MKARPVAGALPAFGELRAAVLTSNVLLIRNKAGSALRFADEPLTERDGNDDDYTRVQTVGLM